MIYPLSTIIKYILGNNLARSKLIPMLTFKSMLKYHAINIFFSAIFTLMFAKVTTNLMLNDPTYSAITELFTINTWTMFAGYIPFLLLFYFSFLVFLIILSIIYFIISRLFGSKINLPLSIISLQPFAILHPLFHGFMVIFILLSSNLLIGEIMLWILTLFLILIVFTASKQYSKLSRITLITILLLNVIILAIFAIAFYLLVNAIIGSIAAI